MRTPHFAQVACFSLLACSPALADLPLLIGGPGLPVAVGDAAGETLLVAGKPRTVKRAVLLSKPASQGPTGTWLTGQAGGVEWVQSDTATPGGVTIRWLEPLTSGEFDAARLQAKGLTKGDAVWLRAADITLGRAVLAEAAKALLSTHKGLSRTDLERACAAALTSPPDRWRAAALITAAGGTLNVASLTPEPAGVWAAQTEGAWAAGLGRLATVDNDAALSLARRLLLLARLPSDDGPGYLIPLWTPPDPVLLEALLAGSPAGMKTAAAALLAAEPGELVWVHDDAGLRSAELGTPVSTLCILNLLEKPRVVRLRIGDGETGEPIAATPLAGLLLRGTTQPSPARQGSGTASLTWSGTGGGDVTLPLAATHVPAVAPGLLIGPFVEDWTLASLRSGRREERGGIAGALTPGDAGTWVLYLERRLSAGEEADGDRLRVWCGPSGSPTLDLPLTPDGGNPRTGEATVQTSRLAGGAGGWCAKVVLPASLVDDTGILRLAVEHRRSDGSRRAWPRPLTPFAVEPGRMAIDCAAWNKDLAR